MTQFLQKFRTVQSIYASFDAAGQGSDTDGTIQEIIFPIYKGITYMRGKLFLPAPADLVGADAFGQANFHIRCNFYGTPEYPEHLADDSNTIFRLPYVRSYYTDATKLRWEDEFEFTFEQPYIPHSLVTGQTIRRQSKNSQFGYADGQLLPIICRTHFDMVGAFQPNDGTKWFAYWEVGCA